MNSSIFIFGSPRSGVTLLENIFGIHPELTWLSQYNNLLPKRVEVSFFNRLYKLPFLELALYQIAWKKRFFGKSILPIPYEAWNFWEKHLPSFKKGAEALLSNPPSGKDMSDDEAEHIRKTITQILRFQGNNRFFATYGDFPRISYLSKAFPNALFIHLVRDGRAVCESYFRMNQLGNYKSWDEREMWLNKMSKSWRDCYFQRHNNLFSFGVYRWMYYLDLCWKESLKITSKRFLQISYESIVHSPIDTVRQIQSFANLECSSLVESYIRKVPPINCNKKWEKALNREQLDEFFQIVTEEKYLNLLDDPAKTILDK